MSEKRSDLGILTDYYLGERSQLSGATLTPAYGRDYATWLQVAESFREGKDFKFNSPHAYPGMGTYCSIRDFMPGDHVTLRYSKLTKSVEVTI